MQSIQSGHPHGGLQATAIKTCDSYLGGITSTLLTIANEGMQGNLLRESHVSFGDSSALISAQFSHRIVFI